MWFEDRVWHGRRDEPGAPTRTAKTRSAVLGRLRRDAGASTLTVEVVPELVGVAEAARIMGWDKRRVFTYIARGAFPEPVSMLASGRIWRRRDVEAFARDRRRRSRKPKM
jgi:predicted DNA-binding transcriptional regulator AlpA